jgi:hypothetical protein
MSLVLLNSSPTSTRTRVHEFIEQAMVEIRRDTDTAGAASPLATIDFTAGSDEGLLKLLALVGEAGNLGRCVAWVALGGLVAHELDALSLKNRRRDLVVERWEDRMKCGERTVQTRASVYRAIRDGTSDVPTLVGHARRGWAALSVALAIPKAKAEADTSRPEKPVTSAPTAGKTWDLAAEGTLLQHQIDANPELMSLIPDRALMSARLLWTLPPDKRAAVVADLRAKMNAEFDHMVAETKARQPNGLRSPDRASRLVEPAVGTVPRSAPRM